MKNEESHVARTLESMVAQTVRPLEWLIVNDGSTDASAEIVEDYTRQHSWIRRVDLAGLGERAAAHYGGHVVDVFYEGLANVIRRAVLRDDLYRVS
jgi:glycosyltransferase involved in cell wall biosynthesis